MKNVVMIPTCTNLRATMRAKKKNLDILNMTKIQQTSIKTKIQLKFCLT